MTFSDPYMELLKQTIEPVVNQLEQRPTILTGQTTQSRVTIEKQEKAYINANNRSLYIINITNQQKSTFNKPDWRGATIVYNPSNDLEPQRLRKSITQGASKEVTKLTNTLYNQLAKHVN